MRIEVITPAYGIDAPSGGGSKVAMREIIQISFQSHIFL